MKKWFIIIFFICAFLFTVIYFTIAIPYSTYNQLMRETHLSSKPGNLGTVDEVVQNLHRKAEIKRRAEEALIKGKITQDQYSEISRELIRPPRSY